MELQRCSVFEIGHAIPYLCAPLTLPRHLVGIWLLPFPGVKLIVALSVINVVTVRSAADRLRT